MKLIDFKKVTKKVNDLRLVQKLLLSYFALIILPLSLLSYLFYNNVAKIIEKRITYSAEQAFDQSYSFLSYKLTIIYGKANSLLNNVPFLDILEKSNSRKDLLDMMSDVKNLSSYLQSMEDQEDISRVKIYIADNTFYSNDRRNIFSLDVIQSAKWYKYLRVNGNSPLWVPSSYAVGDNTPLSYSLDLKNEDLLSYVKSIPDSDDLSKSIGIIRFDFTKKSVIDILKKANSIDNSFSYIQNSRGDIIATSSETLMKSYVLPDINLLKSNDSLNNWTTTRLSNKQVLINSQPIEFTDWTMLTIIPISEILSDSKNFRNYILILLLIIGTIAYFVAYKISYSITKRISSLANNMRELHKGELKAMDEPSSKDEIGLLINDYNYMLEKISKLIEEQYLSGQQLKSSELKALQSQINPHFLYNTLDMINWYAWKNKGPEIISVVEALAKFYKLSLNKGADVVSINDELAHVFYYFHIQNMRFKNALKLVIDVSDEIKEYSIIKITLQPIVENAIFHGIMGKEDQKGTITISSRIEMNDIIFEIKDDGIGMSENTLDNILDGISSSIKGSGYGVKNVNDRIKLHYGAQYGLMYKSEFNKGTTVEIRINKRSITDSPVKPE